MAQLESKSKELIGSAGQQASAGSNQGNTNAKLAASSAVAAMKAVSQEWLKLRQQWPGGSAEVLDPEATLALNRGGQEAGAFDENVALARSLIACFESFAHDVGAVQELLAANPAQTNVVYSPSTITSDQNNYDNNGATVLRLSTDASRTITGFTATNMAGRFMTILNIGSFDIVLANESGSSTAANRIVTGTGADYTIPAGRPMTLYYDLASLRWRRSDANSGVGGSSTVKSAIFITNMEGSGGSTVSDKTYLSGTSPASKVLDTCDVDGDGVTVTVEVDAGPDGAVASGWQPTVTIRGGDSDIAITNLSPIVTNTRRFTGSATISVGTFGDNTIYADSVDGGQSQNVTVDRLLDPPVVSSISWTNQGTLADPYPADQTQFKEGDYMQIQGLVDTHADEIYIRDAGATNGEGEQGPYTHVAGVWTATNVVAGNTTGLQSVTVYAKVTGGSDGPDEVSTNQVEMDQTSPTATIGSITYPGGQEAIKDTEDAQVTITHTNAETGDTYTYDDNSTSELTISNTQGGGSDTTTYQATKWVKRASGGYRDDTDSANYRVTIKRDFKNGKEAIFSQTVEIAHDTPLVGVDDANVSYGSIGTVARMGTDDGTNGYKDRNLYVISNQKHLSTSTSSISPDAGDTSAFTGSWTEQSDFTYRRNFRVEDGDINTGGQANNDFSWTSVSVTNRANRSASTATKNPDYSIGGFDTRTINMGPITGGDPPYTHTGDIGCPVVDTSKTTVINTSKGGTPTLAYEANVTEHNDADSSLNNFWTTVAGLGSEVFTANTQYFHCSDKKFYDSVTAPAGFNCTIAESV